MGRHAKRGKKKGKTKHRVKGKLTPEIKEKLMSMPTLPDGRPNPLYRPKPLGGYGMALGGNPGGSGGGDTARLNELNQRVNSMIHQKDNTADAVNERKRQVKETEDETRRLEKQLAAAENDLAANKAAFNKVKLLQEKMQEKEKLMTEKGVAENDEKIKKLELEISKLQDDIKQAKLDSRYNETKEGLLQMERRAREVRELYDSLPTFAGSQGMYRTLRRIGRFVGSLEEGIHNLASKEMTQDRIDGFMDLRWTI